MAHVFLVPILVFLHAVLPPDSAAELPSPELLVHPEYHPYYEGENVEFSCVAKINKTVGGYQFFSRDGPVVPKLVINGFWSGQLFVTVQREKAGTYSCEYWRGDIGEGTSSQRSNTITLDVQEAPKKPSLALNHIHPENRWGDYVSLVCSAPPEAKEIVEFQYFGDRQIIQAPKPLNNTDIYNLSITEPKDLGKFRCAYIQFLSGRNVRSKKSDPVFIDLAASLGSRWGRILATGGAFFTINGLIFLITHYYFLPKVSARNCS
ncbi:uncharacterized protein LOC143825754 isoform X2 [Paroedura picta]|uniref:uncharacterized protein LOC143825754 isoform X2 n=1 Tax=Paroedura picta TaxID=143630 RepID=UPI004056C4C5